MRVMTVMLWLWYNINELYSFAEYVNKVSNIYSHILIYFPNLCTRIWLNRTRLYFL